jgi:hypothetical protein
MSYFDKFGDKHPDAQRDYEAEYPDYPPLRAFEMPVADSLIIHSTDACSQWLEVDPDDIIQTRDHR